jgi:hypothetical protein
VEALFVMVTAWVGLTDGLTLKGGWCAKGFLPSTLPLVAFQLQ